MGRTCTQQESEKKQRNHRLKTLRAAHYICRVVDVTRENLIVGCVCRTTKYKSKGPKALPRCPPGGTTLEDLPGEASDTGAWATSAGY